ncbi:MAG: hypothetical protein CMJ27_00575 [Phycisphaerae bacterium]|nr:hypothetical protein [Phycisphaerae bacterium]OUX03255.1 MAG: hypothetical protein CBD91_00455 [Phycisphaeraceae bacterium TMED231]
MRRTIPLPVLFLTSAAIAASASAETITVCTKGCDHTSIQAAIDASAEVGDGRETPPHRFRLGPGGHDRFRRREAGRSAVGCDTGPRRA